MGWCWLCVRGELETGTDCYILTPGSSVYSSTSSSFYWAAEPWVLRAPALCLELVLTPQASYLQMRLELTASNSNWLTRTELCLPRTPTALKPPVALGYIIVWHPPASCGRKHLHRIQPVLRSRWYSDIFDQMHLFLDWRFGRGSICYINKNSSEISIVFFFQGLLRYRGSWHYRKLTHTTKHVYFVFHYVRRGWFDNSYWYGLCIWDDKQLTRPKEHEKIWLVSWLVLWHINFRGLFNA